MKWHYFVHLTAWTVPLLALQWAIGWKIFYRNLRAIFAPALIGAAFFSLIDQIAVSKGIWFFDPGQILGLFVGLLPFEEVLFFLLTCLLVTQSLILLLPREYRH